MNRMAKTLTAVALIAGLSGCVSQDDFDRHIDRIDTWSSQVYDWQTRTWSTICDIATVLDPSAAGDLSSYGTVTQAYCGPGDGGGEPDPPPDWGTE